MRKLESETRKQEQICNSKKALMETVSNSARKQAQDQLRAVNSHQKEVGLNFIVKIFTFLMLHKNSQTGFAFPLFRYSVKTGPAV